MSKPFRIIDTGVREGRANIAFDAALIEARQNGDVPDTIRFLRFPPTALIGRHQDLSREVDLDYCRQHRIGTVRRITGGGAIYLDEGQLGWELVFHRSSLGIAALPDLAREICNAAALGLKKLGVDAKFRPRNDIEVDGRKISGTGGFYDGDVLIYQGTVLVDLNPQRMVNALHVPDAKLAKRQLDSAAQRVVTLKELLGPELPDLEYHPGGPDCRLSPKDWASKLLPGEITETEERLAKEAFDDEIGSDEFVAEIDDPASDDDEVLAGTHTRAPAARSTPTSSSKGSGSDVLQRVLISGDFFVTPPQGRLRSGSEPDGRKARRGRRRNRRFLRSNRGGHAERVARRLQGLDCQCTRKRPMAKCSPDAFAMADRSETPMNVVAVVQHTSGEYLGLIEDHFEHRRIRFQYFRPFASGGKLPSTRTCPPTRCCCSAAARGVLQVGRDLADAQSEEVALTSSDAQQGHARHRVRSWRPDSVTSRQAAASEPADYRLRSSRRRSAPPRTP